MKGALAFLAASLCIVAASAIVAPVQQGAVLDGNGGPAVDLAGRQLLHKDDHHDDYNYDWHQYSHYDNVVYKAAKWAIKVLGKNDSLLRALFGSYYEHGYKPKFINLIKAYYYEDNHHNYRYFKLTIYFEYNHRYYTYDFIVYATYYHHYYDFKYLYKIIYSGKALTGKWW